MKSDEMAESWSGVIVKAVVSVPEEGVVVVDEVRSCNRGNCGRISVALLGVRDSVMEC